MLITYARRVVAQLDLVTASRLDDIASNINRKLDKMADQITETLTVVTEGLKNRVGPAVLKLIEERNAFATRVAELEGTEVAQSAAAGEVKTAFDEIAGALTGEPQAPDVEPLPDVPAPVEPSTDPAPAGEGETDEAGTPVVGDEADSGA